MINANLEKITLDDFSPGIWNDWQGAGGGISAPQGAAQLTGTFGCVASVGGGLMAAPKKVNTQTQALIDATTGTDNKYPTGDYRVHILALRNMSPVYKKAAGGGTQSEYPDMPWLGMQWWYDSTGVGTTFKQRTVVRAYKSYLASPSTYTPVNATATNGFAVGNFPSYGYIGLDIGRSNSPDPTKFGGPVMACSWYAISALPGTGEFGSFIYPPNTAPTTDATQAFWWDASGAGMMSIFSHQDRFLGFAFGFQAGAIGTDFGVNGGVEQTELVAYTNVNDVGGTTANVGSWVNENPHSYGSWKSINAGELFLVKKRGGAVILRGDVVLPIVIRLPGAEPTGLAVNIGSPLPDGSFLYGSERGVYAWNGGDATKSLSPGLSGWFWKNTTDKAPDGTHDIVDQLINPVFFRSAGRDLHPAVMGSWAPCGGRLVFGPNNFCYDTHGGGWWRHTDPSAGIIYGFHDAAARNMVLASPYYLSATQTEAVAWFDPEQGQTHYEWISQPLKVTQGRELDFREVEILAQGAGTVTVTVIGINGATSSQTFTITATARPESQTLGVGVHTHDAVVKIVSDSGSSAAAPKIYRVALGHNVRQTTRAASS